VDTFRLQQPLLGGLGALLPRCYPGTSERHLKLLSIDQPSANGFTPQVNCIQPLQPHPMTTDVIPDLAPFFSSLTTLFLGRCTVLALTYPRSFLAQPISLFIHIPTKCQWKVSGCVQLKEFWGNRIMLVPCKCLSDTLSPASGKDSCPVLRNSFRLHVSRSILIGSHISRLSIPSLHSSSSPSYFSFLGFNFTKSAPH
jgi:hypothetical protein